MTLTLTPSTEARLLALAQRRGQTPEATIEAVIEREVAAEPETADSSAPLTAQTDPTLALFAKWAEEDKTDDPEEIAQRQREGDELLAALQANHLCFRSPALSDEDAE